MGGIVGRTDQTMRGIDQMTQTLHEVFKHGGYPNIRGRICQFVLFVALVVRHLGVKISAEFPPDE